ncbi:hypothetical protein ACFP56_17425 [Paenibacillus septentrionalis]|uniref:Uncharacterized protein n=1 Tax=Paenibacillus septentrionalis TaxID=429342 RepID=A0ABW1V9H0_9BACL
MTIAIAVQPYIMIERVVANLTQKTTIVQHELSLFETKITSSQHEFLLQNVYDMSYKIISGEEGFLYVHTNQGVYAFHVRTDPSTFILAYRSLSYQ